MAIKKINEDAVSLQVDINNGDLKALNDIKETWGFKDYESILRYAIAILKLSDKNLIYTIKDGTTKTLSPADDLLVNG